MSDIPSGFTPLFRTSPFLDAMGPFYQRTEGDNLIIGLRITEHHTNTRGTAHGGLLLAMADIALGYNAAFVDVVKESGATPNTLNTLLTTASMTADFAGSAKLGDWAEAHVDIQKVGSRLAHVSQDRRRAHCPCQCRLFGLTQTPSPIAHYRALSVSMHDAVHVNDDRVY
jgi:acyl-coenzyme A thioesterase 13